VRVLFERMEAQNGGSMSKKTEQTVNVVRPKAKGTTSTRDIVFFVKIGLCLGFCVMVITMIISGQTLHRDSARGVTLLVGVATAYLAFKKGYNPWRWLFSGGLAGLVILLWLDSSADSSEKYNWPGVVMSIYTVIWITASSILSLHGA
jgi:hypothetical protein